MNVAEEIVREIPKGLINWYSFEQGSRVLFVGSKEHVLAEVLVDKGCAVVCAQKELLFDETWQSENAASFDYVLADRVLEKEAEPGILAKVFAKVIKPEGVLLLSADNRFGIRYFCGDRDPYTDRNFDSVEGYRRAYSRAEDIFEGRMYSKAELQKILGEAGWEYMHFYSVLSDIDNPALLFSEDYLPNEDLVNRVFPTYHYPDTVFLEEEGLYNGLAENNMFHQMANAYLVECSRVNREAKVLHVTNSLDRGKCEAMQTVICADNTVCKRPLYEEGKEKINHLLCHGEELKSRGIAVVDASLEDGVYKMPFMAYETGQKHLKKLLFEDKDAFLKEMDRFCELIFKSSDIVKEDCGDGQGAVLAKGYMDFVPLNSFYADGEYVFFDQEFCVGNCPANVLLWRVIGSFYAGDPEVQKVISRDELLKRYGIFETVPIWQKKETDFLNEILNKKKLRLYHEKCRRNPETVNSNRQRINYSGEEYQRLFVDIFPKKEEQKLILFGSGNFAKRFLEMYGNDYPVHAIIDNRESAWGSELGGVKICSPKILEEMSPDEYKVIICIKSYLSVAKQMDSLGVADYSIYDPGKDYPRKRKTVAAAVPASEESAPKKYKTGYIAGVFDLFHIGHLNMFKRAKEQCEYLIVGVVPDERVEKIKNKRPFIPLEERMEMVGSCRYVDEVVAIPENYGGTRDAWRMYHFDCQFSGSDYVDNPEWLAEKEFLAKHGADLVFFPYTEQTSSTKIKALIEKKLL